MNKTRNYFEKLSGKEILAIVKLKKIIDCGCWKDLLYVDKSFNTDNSLNLILRTKDLEYTFVINGNRERLTINAIEVKVEKLRMLIHLEDDIPFTDSYTIVIFEDEKKTKLKIFVKDFYNTHFKNNVCLNIHALSMFLTEISNPLSEIENIFPPIINILNVKAKYIHGFEFSGDDQYLLYNGTKLIEKIKKIVLNDTFTVSFRKKGNCKPDYFKVFLYFKYTKTSKNTIAVNVYFNKHLTGIPMASFEIPFVSEVEIKQLYNVVVGYPINSNITSEKFKLLFTYNPSYDNEQIDEFMLKFHNWKEYQK